jgi:hypothetical protein
MNKKELYSLLFPKKYLLRKELRKNFIETSSSKKLDDFETEAREGWESSKNLHQNLRDLDKKFISNSWIWWSLTVVLVLTILTILLFPPVKSLIKQEKIQNQVSIERTDLIVDKKIVNPKVKNEINKALNQLHKAQKQVSKKAAQDLVSGENENQEIQKIPIATLGKFENRTNTDFRKKAKEISLNSFLLVDYRVIRNQPMIGTQQLDLTGTSANLENKKPKEEEPVWKMIPVPYMDYLEKSMYFLKKGNLSKGLDRFKVILETYPDDINALFYSGFCEFQKGEYRNAMIFLQRVQDHSLSNFDEDAEWYQFKCSLNLKEEVNVKLLAQKIISRNSYYKSEVIRLISK